MHDGMDHAVNEDNAAGELVEVDVLIQWEEHTEAPRTKKGDAVPQHKDEHKHAVKIQALP